MKHMNQRGEKMTIEISIETDNMPDIPYKKIINNVVTGALEYLDCPYECEVNVILTDNEGIREINKEQRGIDAATDVLSFPMCDFEDPGIFDYLEDDEDDNFDPDTGELTLGDIVVSADKVRSQAEEYGHSETRELAFLVAHSMLHLCGYDHVDDDEREIMEDIQRDILEIAGYTR